MAEVKVVFKSDVSSVKSGVASVHSSISGLKSSVGAMGTAFKTALGPITAITTLLGGIGLGAGIKDILNFGGSISELSSSLGISKDKLVVFQEAFKQSGIDADKLQSILAKLSASISDPSDDLIKWLDRFNISLSSIQALGVGEQFELIGQKIGSLTTPAQRISAAMDIFGKKVGATLIPLFRTKDAMADAATQVGGLAGSMVKYADQFDYIGDIFGGFPAKLRQIFAGMVGLNVDNLIVLADKFKSLDLTSFGEYIGNKFKVIADTIINLMDAFEQKRFGNTIWNGLKYAFLEVKSFLTALFTYLGELFGNKITEAINKSLEGRFGSILFPNSKDKRAKVDELEKTYQNLNENWYGGWFSFKDKLSSTFKGVDQEDTLRIIRNQINRLKEEINKLEPPLENFWDILKRVGEEAEVDEAYNTYMDPKRIGDATRERDDFIEDWNSALSDYTNVLQDMYSKILPKVENFNPGDIINSTAGIMIGGNWEDMSREFYTPEIPYERAEYTTDDYKPIVTSLGNIGGDISARINSFTNNPLVTLQTQANAILTAIRDNTSKSTAPTWQPG